MANKKINELSTRTPSLTDLILVGDPTSGYSYKSTVTALATIIETDIADAYVTLDTAQTISGAKTFSNNLTLTSVTNAATTQTKFLTLNGSNVVNYRTGSQVLADIGGASAALYVPYTGATTDVVLGMNNITANNLNVQPTGFGLLASLTRDITGSGYGILLLKNGANGYLQPAVLGVDRTWTLPNASGTVALTSDLSSYVPTSRTLTINGTSYDLSANRTWSVGTVTSVGLTTGTTGTDVNVSGSPVTSSGTITLNIPTASATSRGVLLSSDWTTFNNKQNAITLTTSGTSGAATLVGSTLNIPQYQAALTNPVTGTGTTNYIPKFTSSSAIGNSQIFDNGTNVGINNASPAYKLDVNGQTRIAGQLTLSGVGTSELYTADASGLYLTAGTAAGMYLQSDGVFYFRKASSPYTEYMRLTSSGLLGIGTSAPTAKLTVSGTTSDQIRVYEVTDATNYYRIGRNSTTGFLDFYGNQSGYVGYVWGGINGERMRLDASGNLNLGQSTSALQSGGTGLTIYGSSASEIKFLNSSTGSAATDGTALVTSSLDFNINNREAGSLIFGTSNAERARIDASGNLGLGVTPSAWGSGQTAIQIGSRAALVNASAGQTLLGNNYYSNGTNNIYLQTAAATLYEQYAGSHVWYNAGSGTAGNAISFTQAMTLFSTGNLAVGGTSDAGYRLDISGNARINKSSTTTVFEIYNTDTNDGNGVYIKAGGVNSGKYIMSLVDGSNNSRVHFLANGNVGIGTTSPDAKLQVQGTASSSAFLRFGRYSGYSGGLEFRSYTGSGGWDIKTSTDATNANLVFSRSEGTGNYVFSDANVGIGTTSPTYKLQVGDLANTSGVLNDIFITGDRVNTNNYYARLIFGNSSQSGGSTASIRGERMDGSNFATGLTFYTNGTGSAGDGSERMRITSGGNVGIGTSSPGEKLEVNGHIKINNGLADGGQLILSSSGYSDWNIDNYNGALRAYYGSTEYFRVTNGGQVGIGLTNPTAALEVNGGIKTSAPLGGTAQQWKFGSKVNATVVLITGSYIELEVGGTLYKLALVN